MQVDLDDDTIDKIFVTNLKWHYNMLAEPTNLPHYSRDPVEEEKMVKKMRKAMKKVINYYSSTLEQIE